FRHACFPRHARALSFHLSLREWGTRIGLLGWAWRRQQIGRVARPSPSVRSAGWGRGSPVAADHLSTSSSASAASFRTMECFRGGPSATGRNHVRERRLACGSISVFMLVEWCCWVCSAHTLGRTSQSLTCPTQTAHLRALL